MKLASHLPSDSCFPPLLSYFTKSFEVKHKGVSYGNNIVRKDERLQVIHTRLQISLNMVCSVILPEWARF